MTSILRGIKQIDTKLTINEQADQMNPKYDYKFWDEMTPKEKMSSANYGRGVTVFNQKTQKYSTKFPVLKSESIQEAIDINDDDWYEINPNTNTVVMQRGPQSFRMPFGQREIKLPNGNIVMRGMGLKTSGLDKTLKLKQEPLSEEEQLDEDLRKWFKEKWVRFGPDGEIRGDCARGDDSEGKPKCLPQSKAQNLGKKGRASAAARKRREDPNPERSGKAINVATKKKSNEGMAEGLDQPREAGKAIQSLKNLAVMKSTLTMQQLSQAGREAIVSNAINAAKTLEQSYLQNKQQGNAIFVRALRDEIDNFSKGYPINSSMPETDTASELGDLLQGKLGKVNFQQGVAEGYQFKGGFPFDVDHMSGSRGINLPSAPTKKFFTDKKQWKQAVDDINSSKYDDNSDYIGVTGRSTVEINGHEWARWSDAQQKGYIELNSMTEQGVAEAAYNPDTFVGKKGTYKGYGITQEGPRQWGISSSVRKFPTLDAAKRHIDKNLVAEQGVAEAGNKPVEKSYFGMGDTRTPRDIKSQMRGASDNFVKSTADTTTGPIHSRVAKMQAKMAKSELRKRSDHDRMATGTNEGVAEGFDKEAEAYKAHLLKTAPKVMDFLSKTVKGWRPSEEEMLGAIDTGYIVMKHTGDVKQAGKAMMDELNTLHRMSQGQQGVTEEQLDELKCWPGYHRVAGTKAGFPGSCKKKTNEENIAEDSVPFDQCPHCRGPIVHESMLNEKQDACYHKVKSRYKVWPSAYASGALVQCRKKGASNWGTKSESVAEAEKNPHTSALGKALYRDLSKEKKASPQQVQRNKERWAQRQADKEQGVAEDSMPYPHGKPEAGDKITWYHSNNYPEIEGTVVGWKDGHLIVQSVDPSPRNTEKTVAKYRVPKNNILSVEKQGLAEGVAETLPMNDAVKLLRQYGADNFKTTSNELHFYKNGRHLSVDLVMNPDATRSVTLRSLNSATRGLKGQGAAEDQLDEKWSQKYKSSINCSNPKGFSQKAHCAGKKKNESAILTGLQLHESK